MRRYIDLVVGWLAPIAVTVLLLTQCTPAPAIAAPDSKPETVLFYSPNDAGGVTILFAEDGQCAAHKARMAVSFDAKRRPLFVGCWIDDGDTFYVIWFTKEGPVLVEVERSDMRTPPPRPQAAI